MLRTAAVTLLLVVAAAPPARAQWPLTSCTALGQNLFVRDVLFDLYLWPDELRGANPGSYRSPEAYLEAARYRPLDDTFSYITSRAASEALFRESRFVGVGMSTAIVGGELRVLQVFPDSPAAAAGLSRGDRILAIGGADASHLIETGVVDAALGPAVEGVVVEMESRAGTARGTRRGW